MPKVKRYTKVKPFLKTSAAIAYRLKMIDMSVQELTERTNIKCSTMYQRLNNPERFRLEELSMIARVLGVTITELVNGKIEE